MPSYAGYVLAAQRLVVLTLLVVSKIAIIIALAEIDLHMQPASGSESTSSQQPSPKQV